MLPRCGARGRCGLSSLGLGCPMVVGAALAARRRHESAAEVSNMDRMLSVRNHTEYRFVVSGIQARESVPPLCPLLPSSATHSCLPLPQAGLASAHAAAHGLLRRALSHSPEAKEEVLGWASLILRGSATSSWTFPGPFLEPPVGVPHPARVRRPRGAHPRRRLAPLARASACLLGDGRARGARREPRRALLCPAAPLRALPQVRRRPAARDARQALPPLLRAAAARAAARLRAVLAPRRPHRRAIAAGGRRLARRLPRLGRRLALPGAGRAGAGRVASAGLAGRGRLP